METNNLYVTYYKLQHVTIILFMIFEFNSYRTLLYIEITKHNTSNHPKIAKKWLHIDFNARIIYSELQQSLLGCDSLLLQITGKPNTQVILKNCTRLINCNDNTKLMYLSMINFFYSYENDNYLVKRVKVTDEMKNNMQIQFNTNIIQNCKHINPRV